MNLDWQQQAACRHDTASMFPEAGDRAGAERAKAVCAGCPVLAECDAWRIQTRPAAGVWAGVWVDAKRVQATCIDCGGVLSRNAKERCSACYQSGRVGADGPTPALLRQRRSRARRTA